MPKSMKLFLRISLFLFLILTSCATNSVVQDFVTVPLERTTFEVPYFANPTMDYVYKANITVYGNELTGIFIAKKINDTTHRVVFTTEFGNKLLDFEISEKEFKVNSIVSELDRKLLITTLVADFRLVLRSNYELTSQFDAKDSVVYLAEDGKMLNYLFVSKLNNNLSKIVHSSKRKEKINVLFTSENNIFASNIIIQHTTIKLKIELNYFNEQLN